MSRQYYGIEDLGLTAPQRAVLLAALCQLGAANAHPNPSHRNHWRTRPDGQAALFEALWDSSDWTVARLKAILGQVFDVDPETITATTASTPYGPLATFGRAGVDRLRLLAFGGIGATWSESHAAALAYLAANAAAWSEEV